MRRTKLIDARKALGKTQEQVAEEVGVERQTVSDWERGVSTPHPPQRPTYAEALELSLGELAAYLSSLPTDTETMPEWLSTYLGMEQSATELRAFEPELVYGLLQTPGYTEAIVRKVGTTEVPDSYVQKTIDQRRHRQTRVKDGSLTLDVVQTEQVLHVRVGDASVMAEQLHALADAAERPNITVRIAPFDAGQFEARRLDTFLIMAWPWGSPRVYIEGYGGGRFIGDADEVAYFSAAYEQATKVALTPADSVTFIREMAQRWETRR